MSPGIVWRALAMPMLIAAITGWSLIVALLSDSWLEWTALALLSGVVVLVIARLYQGARRRSAAKAGGGRAIQ